MDTLSFVPGKEYTPLPFVTADFDYPLPDERIAQTPFMPRDGCRLLVLDKETGAIRHRTFTDILDLLEPDDLLVVNDTRVLPARLNMRKESTGGAVEVLLLDKIESTDGHTQKWHCLVKPGKSARVGQRLVALADKTTAPVLEAQIVGERDEGVRIIELTSLHGTVEEAIRTIGQVPLPPYITQEVEDSELYQTVYAHDERSAAAPTAGLHFTDELLQRIKDRGVRIATVRLDVGLDTFRPVSVKNPTDHHIHTEYIQVDTPTIEAIIETRKRSGRVVAVGTTTTRALETMYRSAERDVERDAPDVPETLRPFAGTSGLFIVPGYEFGVVDALVTNFHVPRSTLMMMVSAFADRDTIMEVYRCALECEYRFLSFGDAMLIQ